MTAAPAAPPLGSPRLHLRRTDSTNERARVLAAAGAPHGTLVTAAAQTAGRGRQGRSWSAPPGSSLLASLVLAPPPRLLPLAAAVAVCDAVEELLAGGDAPGGAGARPTAPGWDAAMIKWPNDVVVARGQGLAKLAGILIEARPQQGWGVLGIGLNVAVELEELPVELRGTAATMGLTPDHVEPLLPLLLTALDRRLAETPAMTLAAWGARDALRGRTIEWGLPDDAGTDGPASCGVAQGIDGDGRLIVALPDGARTALGAGEVHLRPVG
jgi:BirA family transcriptional regulator, biotin operon repressor / biotin---[acetyl-CoA-carboxylase] ligase